MLSSSRINVGSYSWMGGKIPLCNTCPGGLDRKAQFSSSIRPEFVCWGSWHLPSPSRKKAAYFQASVCKALPGAAPKAPSCLPAGRAEAPERGQGTPSTHLPTNLPKEKTLLQQSFFILSWTEIPPWLILCVSDTALNLPTSILRSKLIPHNSFWSLWVGTIFSPLEKLVH